MSILTRFKKPAASAAEFRERMSEIDAALPAAEAAVRDARARRSAALLDETDAEVEKIEAVLAKAIRDRDRLLAAHELAEQRAVEAEQAEEFATLETIRAEAEAKAQRVAGRLRPEYEKLGTGLISLLAELGEAEEAVIRANEVTRLAGRADFLAPVEERVLGLGFSSGLPVASIRALTSLRPVGDMPGWGAGRQAAEIANLPR